MYTSARPRRGGRQPAKNPIQAAPSIWNGSHGPTPPVSSADTNSVSAPSTNPKPRPSTRPAGINRKNTGSKPATPPLGRRSAAPHAASTPRRATALASSAPSASSASTTASRSGNNRASSQGASAEWAVPAEPDGSDINGHPNATTPISEQAASNSHDRVRRRI